MGDQKAPCRRSHALPERRRGGKPHGGEGPRVFFGALRAAPKGHQRSPRCLRHPPDAEADQLNLAGAAAGASVVVIDRTVALSRVARSTAALQTWCEPCGAQFGLSIGLVGGLSRRAARRRGRCGAGAHQLRWRRWPADDQRRSRHLPGAEIGPRCQPGNGAAADAVDVIAAADLM